MAGIASAVDMNLCFVPYPDGAVLYPNAVAPPAPVEPTDPAPGESADPAPSDSLEPVSPDPQPTESEPLFYDPVPM